MLPKLVRDKVIDEIRARGAIPIFDVLDPIEGIALLAAKLHEEAAEVRAELDRITPRAAVPPEIRRDLISELADVMTVVYEIAEFFKIERFEVYDALIHKFADQGGFRRFILLRNVVDPEDCTSKVPG